MIEPQTGDSVEAVVPASGYVPWLDTDPSFVVQDPEIRRRLADITPRPAEVLDAGCGSGTLLYNLARWYPQARITGLDASPATAQRIGPFVPRARIIVGNVLDMPIASASIDLLTATQIIEHVPEAPFLTELRRVLKPDGKLLVSSVIRLPGARYLYRNSQGETVLEPTHLREYQSLEAFEGVLHRHGFKIEYSAARPVRFSLLDLVARRIGGSAKASAGWRLALRKAAMIRIPRYYYCECIVTSA